jgi:hypothetical protein
MIRNFLVTLLAALALCPAVRADDTAGPGQKLLSPDGSVEVTVGKDGRISGRVRDTGDAWTLPRGGERYEHPVVAFAPKGLPVVRQGPVLYILAQYASPRRAASADDTQLVCVRATGGAVLWRRTLSMGGNSSVSFSGPSVIVKRVDLAPGEFITLPNAFDSATGKPVNPPSDDGAPVNPSPPGSNP